MGLINKKTILAFVLGVIVAIFVVHAYVVYQVRDIALQNQVAISQIVNFINQASGEAEVSVTP